MNSDWLIDWGSGWVHRQLSSVLAKAWREQLHSIRCCWCRFVPDPHAKFDLYSASSLKQQSVDRHGIPFGHIILFPSQLVLMFSREAANANFIVIRLVRKGLESAIYWMYCTPGGHANHYSNNAIDKNESRQGKSYIHWHCTWVLVTE